MKEVKLPEIKLFGKKIALPENERAGENSSSRKSGNENSSGSDSDCYLDPNKVCQVDESDDNDVNKQEADKISLGEECSKTKSEEEGNDPMVEEPQNPKDLSDCDNSPDTPSLDEDSAGKQSPDSENDQSDTNTNSQGKNLKKPDKILPCPRCNSMETKFCYYNNYNVNQPRHFCKSCQRYWTAGGTMRNVPVGAGRRKNKNSVSSCRHLTISEALQAAQFDAANGFHHPNVKPNGTVLSFGPELPLNDSTTALLKLNKLDSGTIICSKGTESGNDFSKGSSIILPNQAAQGGKNGYQETVMQHVSSVPTPVPYFHNLPCPFPTPVPIPVPAICPPGFPMPFYPAPIWNGGIPGSWSFPWLPPVYPAANQNSSGSSSISPTLGKHSRDGVLLLTPKHLPDTDLQDPKSSEGSILIPKTLRIGDPDEAAMSSIWTTLGIKCDSTNQGGLFKAAFQPKIVEKNQSAATSTLLQANPAAFSRSLNFQEIA